MAYVSPDGKDYSFNRIYMALLENMDSKLDEALALLKSKFEQRQDLEELMTVDEAASLLRLSVSRVYTLISKNELPYIKRTKRCYFLRSELLSYLKEGRNRKMTKSEIVAEANSSLNNKREA